jgi:hypothetical protein
VITNVTNNVEEITQYQGAHATDPVARNDGTPLQVGDLYFNTVINELKVWTGTAWVPSSPGSITVQNFTGTGAQTAFNLASAPVAENNTQIYIDGVYQQKDTYSVSGATINFSTAPPNLSGIEVVTFSIASLGTVDSSNVSYNQGGAGAVNTSVQAKLQESVSVKDFGATGDGVTDDTAAIQAAITYLDTLGGGTIHVPRGEYIISSTLDFRTASPANTGWRLIGENREDCIFSTSQDIVLISHAEEFHIEHMTLQQTGTTKTGIGLATPTTKQSAYGMVSNVWFKNFAFGIWWRYSIWNSIRDVATKSCGVGIRLSRNEYKDQANANNGAPGGWNLAPGFFQNVNTLDNVLFDGGEVGLWASPTCLVMNNVTSQGQNEDGSANTVAPVGVAGTGFWLQNNGNNTSKFGVIGNVGNGIYTEYTRQPIVCEYVDLIINGGYFQGGTNPAPYPQVVKATGSTVELNNCSGSDWFQYRVVSDASNIVGGTGGAVTVGAQSLLNDGLNYINGSTPGLAEIKTYSVTGASTTTIGTFKGSNETVKVDVSAIYDGFLPRSASFMVNKTSGGYLRVISATGNSSDITCTLSGSNIQINTTGTLAYVINAFLTFTRKMTGNQDY